jgi:hypothetical protein
MMKHYFHKYSMHNYQVQIPCPLGGLLKGIARTFKWLKCMCGFLHLKPKAECKFSTSILGLVSKKMPWTIPKVLAHLEFKSKVFPGPLSALSACVRLCTSNPQQDVKFQLCY